MKFNFKYIVILLVAFAMSCTTAEYEEPGSISTIGFYNSKGQASVLYVAEAGQMTFSDLSQGAVNHAWTIEGGNFFLEGSFLRNDNYKVFEQSIINEGDTVSNSKSITVYFKKTGENKVRLYNEFKDSVTFPGYNKATETPYTLGSHKVGDRWVIDTTFVVNVIDSIIPEVIVKDLNGVVLDHTVADTIVVEAGDPLFFSDITSIGDPTHRLWQLKAHGSNTTLEGSNSNDFEMSLTTPGIYRATVTVSRTDDVIPNDSERYLLTSPIKIIKPTSFKFKSAIELSNETLYLGFNTAIASFTGKESFFEVKVNGTASSVVSAAVDINNPSFIMLSLGEKIYRDDLITVSLLDGSGITTVEDNLQPRLFTDEVVVMNDMNMLPENVANSDLWAKWWRNATHVELSSARSVIGTKSVKVPLKPGEGSAEAGLTLPSPVQLEAGKTYVIRYKYYIESESTTVMPLDGQLFLLNEWGYNATATFEDGVETNKWLTVESEFTKVPREIVKLWFRLRANGDTTTDATIYIDDFYINEKDVRP